MILQCNISSQDKTKSSPTAIAQPTRDCAANQSSLTNSVVQLTSRYKQIFLPPLKFIFSQRKYILCSFVSWKCFQVCRYITLDKLLFHHVRQTTVSNLCGRTSFRLSQHEKSFVVHLGNVMSLTVYLTGSFFLWGSQRKRLVYVDAMFVSVDVPMLYTLSLLTGLFRQNRWRLHNFLFPWTDEYRFLEPRMTIFVFSTNDHSIVCYHTRFRFVDTFKKSGHKPNDNVLQPWQTNVWRSNVCVIYSVWVFSWKFSPSSPSGAFVKLFSVTSTSCRSDHYPIFGKLCLQKATPKLSSHLFCITLPSLTPTSNLYQALEVQLDSFSFFLKSFG